jgi:DNA helicase TIP49 (TBP-interacting protein)
MTGTPLPQGQPQQGQQARINLDLSIDELNVVIMGLIKLPFETSAPVIDVVRAQANQQVQQLQQQAGQGGAGQPQTVNLQ